MKQKTFVSRVILFLCLQSVLQTGLQAQQTDCTFKEPLFKIDFGTGRDDGDINTFPLPKYNHVFNECPIDGNYSFVSHTSDCFNGDWHTFIEDHTLNDKDGKMMIINANETGGVFLNITINGLKGNTIYQLSACMVNVCKIRGGCPPLPPNIIIRLVTPAGKKVALFQTGLLPQTAAPHWRIYSGIFTTPADITTLILTMEDITHGGCGNDFGLDDITLRECIKPTPVAKAEVKPVPEQAKKHVVPVNRPIVKKIPVKPPFVKGDSPVIISKKTVTDEPVIAQPVIMEKPGILPVPKPILTRENPLIKRIETTAGEILIELYDNGQIDGDTVSIYHNNELIISRARLSKKPISFRIKADIMQPHHELIMVANNLGSIPPNTSLMIITANNKRYEVFISSSEQKNAKIVIDLKK